MELLYLLAILDFHYLLSWCMIRALTYIESEGYFSYLVSLTFSYQSAKWAT